MGMVNKLKINDVSKHTFHSINPPGTKLSEMG